MKTTIDNKPHEVVYIEYKGNIPTAAVTYCLDGNYTKHWDFFANEGDENDMYYYNSCSGGGISQIQAPHLGAYSQKNKYWISDKAMFDGVPVNIKQLKNPALLQNKTRNPFNIAEESNSMEYCEVCGCHSYDNCWEHQYEDNDGNIRYIGTNKMAE